MFLFLAKAGKIALFLLPWAMRERFRRKLYGAAGSWDYLHIRNGVLKQIFLRGIREDLSDCARRIAVPAFLIWGDRDFITPLSDGKRLNELISGSKLEIIAGAGHLVHQERPQEVASLVQKFICQ
jgi:pimeloyl-ACP methyl ester carboxylesterase